MPKVGSDVPGWYPGMPRKEYARLRRLHMNGPPKEKAEIDGIRDGMTRAEKMKVYRRRWAVKPNGRASASECQSRYMETDKGKSRTARANDSVAAQKPIKTWRVQQLNRALRKHSKDRTKYPELGAHFESTFEPWMNWSNYGQYRKNGPRTWNVGHTIPCSAYEDTASEMDKCFHLDNLSAQDSKENATQRMRMPSLAVLATLKHVLPASMCE